MRVFRLANNLVYHPINLINLACLYYKKNYNKTLNNQILKKSKVMLKY